jgi:hypothetical protein
MKKLFWTMLVLLPAGAWACPICKDAWASTTEGLGFAKGIYYSLVLMLGMFFGIVAILIAYIFRQTKRPPRSWVEAGMAGPEMPRR